MALSHQVLVSPSLMSVASCDSALRRGILDVPVVSSQSLSRGVGCEGGQRHSGCVWIVGGASAKDAIKLSDNVELK